MPGLSLIGPAYLLALDREAQEAAFTHRCHLAFGWVDLEFERRVEIPRDASRVCVNRPLSGTLAFDQNDQVIGVTRKAVPPALQLAVELVQKDVGQQWRHRPALRGPMSLGSMCSPTKPCRPRWATGPALRQAQAVHWTPCVRAQLPPAGSVRSEPAIVYRLWFSPAGSSTRRD